MLATEECDCPRGSGKANRTTTTPHQTKSAAAEMGASPFHTPQPQKNTPPPMMGIRGGDEVGDRTTPPH
ncbi:hypothetical protein [Scytonema sp. PCC 10023]|uniref:hypothetical protein n=1 Tax=Scytonema sp. PCC 10023 TaxID=1680591 RepID=UPI0039C6D2BB